MNTPLGNELAVEVSQFLHQVEVVQQEGAARACGAGVLVIGDRSAAGAGEGLRHSWMYCWIPMRGSSTGVLSDPTAS